MDVITSTHNIFCLTRWRRGQKNSADMGIHHFWDSVVLYSLAITLPDLIYCNSLLADFFFASSFFEKSKYIWKYLHLLCLEKLHSKHAYPGWSRPSRGKPGGKTNLGPTRCTVPAYGNYRGNGGNVPNYIGNFYWRYMCCNSMVPSGRCYRLVRQNWVFEIDIS